MIDKSLLLPMVQELKALINEEYLRSGKVIELGQFEENDLNVLDLDVDNLLIIIENLIDRIINNYELTDDAIKWIEKMLETDVITFKRYSKRVVSLRKLAREYPDEYGETLTKLYTVLAIKIVNSYINKVKERDNDFISYRRISLE